jgi:hypothetical protein
MLISVYLVVNKIVPAGEFSRPRQGWERGAGHGRPGPRAAGGGVGEFFRGLSFAETMIT